MIWTLPNILTMSRIAWLPVMFVLFTLEAHIGALAAWICLGVYAIAALTDFFDGYLARKLDQITPFGTFLDPISDKIFVGCLFVLLAAYDRLPGIWILPVLVILTREFLVSGMREYLGPKDIKLPVTNLAKWKTTSQMVAVGFLIIGPFLPYVLLIGQLLLTVSAYLTVVTGWGYLKAGIETMEEPE